jgi:hypothetical protein
MIVHLNFVIISCTTKEHCLWVRNFYRNLELMVFRRICEISFTSVPRHRIQQFTLFCMAITFASPKRGNPDFPLTIYQVDQKWWYNTTFKWWGFCTECFTFLQSLIHVNLQWILLQSFGIFSKPYIPIISGSSRIHLLLSTLKKIFCYYDVTIISASHQTSANISSWRARHFCFIAVWGHSRHHKRHVARQATSLISSHTAVRVQLATT